jgi:hypothetical protein
MLKFLNFILEEEQEKHAVVAFGRMNPPTVGHQALVDKVKEHAEEHGADAHVYLSHSQDAKKNPLSHEHKVKYAQKAFGDIVKNSPAKNPLEALKDLHKKGYQHVTMVAGSDRVDEYKNLLNKYNGHPDHYSFKSINVVSAGHRDPDSEGVSGMSASKMREHAKNGDHELFKSGLPDAIKPHSKELMQHVRSGMNLKESYATVYARVPPKPKQKGPLSRENKSGTLEYLKQLVVGIKNHRKSVDAKPNHKPNKRIIGMYAGDVDKTKSALTESYDSFNIAKPTGYGTFMTAADLGIKIQGGFAHHPSVQNQIMERESCECGCGESKGTHRIVKIKTNNKKKRKYFGDD